MNVFPTPKELGDYKINPYYLEWMIKQLGDGSGLYLEHIAQYLLSCIPGFRASARQRTEATDYDVVCVLEGDFLDFRSLVDRYFICECKDWENPVNSTTIFKFASILQSINNFGIVFSTNGISGKDKFKNAEREQVKIYQRDKNVIIVVDLEDIKLI
jgi:hypothetical protein